MEQTRAGHRPCSHLVGGRIVGLPAIAEPAGHGREEHRKAQRFRPEAAAQDKGADRFRAKHAVERLDRLVAYELVFDDPCAMNHPVQSAVGRVDLIDERAEGLLILHVQLHVVGAGPGCTELADRLANLAFLEELPTGLVDHRRLRRDASDL
jgi:hypothetical protein